MFVFTHISQKRGNFTRMLGHRNETARWRWRIQDLYYQTFRLECESETVRHEIDIQFADRWLESDIISDLQRILNNSLGWSTASDVIIDCFFHFPIRWCSVYLLTIIPEWSIYIKPHNYTLRFERLTSVQAIVSRILHASSNNLSLIEYHNIERLSCSQPKPPLW